MGDIECKTGCMAGISSVGMEQKRGHCLSEAHINFTAFFFKFRLLGPSSGLFILSKLVRKKRGNPLKRVSLSQDGLTEQVKEYIIEVN